MCSIYQKKAHHLKTIAARVGECLEGYGHVPVDEEENIRILWYNKEKCKKRRMVIYEGLKWD